ncbi:MAG: pantoate--beta-alanine ligase [Chitinophagaceae bacterium]
MKNIRAPCLKIFHCLNRPDATFYSFLPEKKCILRAWKQLPSYRFGQLEEVLEGAMRPGHFAGVGKVMSLLLRIVEPDALYMGSKDTSNAWLYRTFAVRWV